MLCLRAGEQVIRKKAISTIVLGALGYMTYEIMVPDLMNGNHHLDGHTKAITALKAYGSAQVKFRKAEGRHAWRLDELSRPVGERPLLETAITEANGRSGKTYSGYIFYTPEHCVREFDWKRQYAAVAEPAMYDSTGVMTFFTDESGVVYMKDLQGHRLKRLPKDLVAERWLCVE